MDEYATARRGAVVRGFIDALTRGRPIPGSPPVSPVGDSAEELGRVHGGPRPIELHAHDPQRYVGDMLAWLHQASASEKESITQLLAECEKCESLNTDSVIKISIFNDVFRELFRG